MNATNPVRPDRFEQVARGMLVMALIGGVLWALASNGSLPQTLRLGYFLG